MTHTTYTTVVVTRNRPDALRLSLPLFAAQTRPPERILIIDSSDDPSRNRETVEEAGRGSAVPIAHHTSPSGMTVQRNIGLGMVESDVVFFPDDDSLPYPDALSVMMRIYDLDTERRIGGVAGKETAVPPIRELAAEGKGHRRTAKDILRARIAPLRTRIEDRLVPDPMKLAARRLQSHLPAAAPWLAREEARWVEWMTGFRMSFRTDLVREVGFNERLGRYALYEDIDAGLGVLSRGHSLVCAERALIYHHKAPDQRTRGHEMGVINILNRAYVVLRSGVADADLRAAVMRYSRFRIGQFSAGARGTYGQDRLAGARAAYDALPEFLSCGPDEIEEAYVRIRQSLVSDGAPPSAPG